MALIFIKRRKEPIEISDERARKIKNLRFGDIDGIGKAEPTEMIDLGDEWAGELGQIIAVELTKKKSTTPVMNEFEKQVQDEQRLRELPPEKRIEVIGFGFFKLAWWMRSNKVEETPSEEIIALAREAALKYLAQYPFAVRIPSDIYEGILTKYWGKKQSTNTAEGGLRHI